MMLGSVLRLVPALRWPTLFAVQDAGHQRVAINTCNAAVDLYFPCNSSTIIDHTCLCDQYLWRISCYDNHASTQLSHPDRTTAETEMNSHCHAAGSIGADMVQRRHRLHSRQIGDLFSSIVGGVSSVLSTNGVTVPTAVITSAVGSVVGSFPTPADPTSIAAAITSDIGTSATSEPSSSATTSDETTSSDAPTSSDASPTESAASTTSSEDPSSSTATAAASSDSSSGPSTGLIAGVVVGGVAALALIGIFILLLLRHRKRKSKSKNFTDKEASPTLSSRDDHNTPPTAYASLPQNTYAHNNQHNDTYAPTETNTYSTGDTTLSPVSPMTPSGNLPWASSTSTFDGRALSGSGYPDEKAHHHQTTQPIPEGTEMPTSANVWEIDGREVPPPSELGDGKRDDIGHGAQINEVARESGDTHTHGPRRKSETGNWSGKEGEFLGSVPVGQAI